MAKKPGVMIYFETGKAIKGLDYETKGRLFEAIMEYAENGTVPTMDGVLSAVWPFIANSIDRDAMSYEKTVSKRKRAAYSKWWADYARENGLNPADKEAKEMWIDMQMHANDANADFAMQTMPTPTPIPTPTLTPTRTSTGTPTTTGTFRLRAGNTQSGNVFLNALKGGDIE